VIALFGLIAALAAASSLPATELPASRARSGVATGRIEGDVTISTAAARPRHDVMRQER
jgi:hypothetical protein